MTPFLIGLAVWSVFPIMFILEDLDGVSGPYDPATSQPMPKSAWDRLKEWHKVKKN